MPGRVGWTKLTSPPRGGIEREHLSLLEIGLVSGRAERAGDKGPRCRASGKKQVQFSSAPRVQDEEASRFDL